MREIGVYQVFELVAEESDFRGKYYDIYYLAKFLVFFSGFACPPLDFVLEVRQYHLEEQRNKYFSF